jgi:hypothetical protein
MLADERRSTHMKHSLRSLAASLAAAVCLWPVAAGAQEVPPQPATGLTVEQAREVFAGAGYQVDEALTWNWTSPPVETFQVRDLHGRILMVLVYGSTTAAQAERLQAAAREQTPLAGQSLSGVGPHLVIGYGTSVWRGNVALVQTTQSELNREYQVQEARGNGVYVESSLVGSPGPARFAVDFDFLQALENGAVNL